MEIDVYVLLEILAELVKFLVDQLLLLLTIVDYVLSFPERELNLAELAYIVLISYLGPEKLEPRYPMMPLNLSLAPKTELARLWDDLPLLNILADTNIKIKGLLLHHTLLTQEDVLNLDLSKCWTIVLKFRPIMKPLNVLGRKYQQS
jgi:hypothetical protein